MLHKPSLGWRDCRAVHRLVFRGKPRSRVLARSMASWMPAWGSYRCSLNTALNHLIPSSGLSPLFPWYSQYSSGGHGNSPTQFPSSLARDQAKPQGATLHGIVWSNRILLQKWISSFHVSIANKNHVQLSTSSWSIAEAPMLSPLLHWHLGSCCVAQNCKLVLVKTRRLEWVPQKKTPKHHLNVKKPTEVNRKGNS